MLNSLIKPGFHGRFFKIVGRALDRAHSALKKQSQIFLLCSYYVWCLWRDPTHEPLLTADKVFAHRKCVLRTKKKSPN